MILNTVHSRIALLWHGGIRTACNSRLVYWSASGTQGHLVELGNVQLVKLSGTHIEIAVHRIDYLIELGFERSGDGVHGAVAVDGKDGLENIRWKRGPRRGQIEFDKSGFMIIYH